MSHRFTQWDVGVGSNVFHQLSTITSREATAHPKFDPIVSANDIGIITLPGSLEFTSNVFPIALPDLNSQQTELLPLENEEGVILGFGFTSTACKSNIRIPLGNI